MDFEVFRQVITAGKLLLADNALVGFYARVGTAVSGELIRPGEPARIQKQDVICWSNTTFKKRTTKLMNSSFLIWGKIHIFYSYAEQKCYFYCRYNSGEENAFICNCLQLFFIFILMSVSQEWHINKYMYVEMIFSFDSTAINVELDPKNMESIISWFLFHGIILLNVRSMYCYFWIIF